MKKARVIGYILLAIFFLVVAMFIVGSFSIVETTNPIFAQYTGNPEQVWFDQQGLIANPVAKFLDYELTISTTSRKETVTCKPNTCNGIGLPCIPENCPVVDEYGCELFDGEDIIQPEYWHSSSNVPDERFGFFCCNNPSATYTWGRCEVDVCYAPTDPQYWQYQPSVVDPNMCGGAEITEEWGCGYNYVLTKNGAVVEQRPEMSDERETIVRDDVIIDMFNANWFSQSQSCLAIQNQIQLIVPDDLFEISVLSTQSTTSSAEIQTTFVNGWRETEVVLKTEVCQPTFYGRECQTFSEVKTIPIGESTQTVQIPLEFIVDEFYVTPSAEIRATPQQLGLENLNIDCQRTDGRGLDGSADPITACAYVTLGSITGDERELSKQLPLDPHYREYTCPLPAGYSMVSETFASGSDISLFEVFRYPVNYFCERFPMIRTSSATSDVTGDIQVYKDVIAGQTRTVPQGETWTFFYVIRDNAQLPLICQNGTYNVNTGECDISAGFIHVCSEGQFDPLLGLCVVQPESKAVCEKGYYDSQIKKCVWHPPLSAECEIGLYNPDTNFCEYEPEISIICAKGTYNIRRDLCEYYPSEEAVCLDGAVYNPASGKCEYTPETVFVCEEGNYNPDTGFCEVNPIDTEFVCDKGVYDPIKGVCVYHPDVENICPEGIYDSSIDKCVVQPNMYYLCPEGSTYSELYQACLKEPELIHVCTIGTYDPVDNVCKVNPDIFHVCPDGTTYNPTTGYCEYFPETYIDCTEGIYDPVTQKCIFSPPVEITCPEDSTYNLQTGLCIKEPPLFNFCPEGSYYDTVTDKCIYNPPLAVICPQGSYDPISKVCVYVPEVAFQCPQGTYNAFTGKCEVEPEVVCRKGTYDWDQQRCIYEPEVVRGQCPEGVWNPEWQVCVVNPNVLHFCEEGVWNEIYQACIINADVEIICPRGTYNPDIDKCVYYPDLVEELGRDLVSFIIDNIFWVIIIVALVSLVIIVAWRRK